MSENNGNGVNTYIFLLNDGVATASRKGLYITVEDSVTKESRRDYLHVLDFWDFVIQMVNGRRPVQRYARTLVYGGSSFVS